MSTSTVPSVTATIEQLKKDGLEFYLNSRLEPTVRIPNDAFQKEWPVDSQRVQDLLVAVHYDISEGGILRSLERDFLLAQLREECRNGGRRFSEFEGAEPVFNRAKALALLSGLRLTEYVVQLLMEAQRSADVGGSGPGALVSPRGDAASGRR
jgi:hypothetical protein